MDSETSRSACNERAFGQVVIGPPGSGKSTYCKAMRELCTAIGRRVAVVNLDPANDVLPYEAAVDISGLVELRDVMDSLKLGPNGGLVYCMEYLESNLEWLCEQLAKVRGCYLFIDCPGQVELYTHHASVRNVVSRLQALGYRLSATHLVDSHYCSDPGKFISVLLTSLATMMHMELPHVNVLSKVDLAEKYGKLHFGLDYYTEVMDLSFLADVLSDKESMWSVLKACDKSNGYIFSQSEEQQMMSLSMGSDSQSQDVIARLRERLETSGTTRVVEDEEAMDNID
ncbi:GPN-loop GTPase 2 isoform X2 [Dermacentor silvarum]|uniref:GPN-loop GTPase 2 isoform X2 n=1 Tax=Dermacentor silvarum TaxID=543639 RepID=UPI0021008EEF|nr:GPN-loop GTPase 2 isoform X2 [Dermacentor silvarum]